LSTNEAVWCKLNAERQWDFIVDAPTLKYARLAFSFKLFAFSQTQNQVKSPKSAKVAFLSTWNKF
jgi:hypothetical protein